MPRYVMKYILVIVDCGRGGQGCFLMCYNLVVVVSRYIIACHPLYQVIVYFVLNYFNW